MDLNIVLVEILAFLLFILSLADSGTDRVLYICIPLLLYSI